MSERVSHGDENQIKQKATPEEIAATVKAFLSSPEGQEQIRKSQEEAEQAVLRLRRARRLTPDQLRVPRSPSRSRSMFTY